MQKYDVIIIGKGPAGISAAIYIQRAGFSSAVIARDSGALQKAEKIENYYGFAEPVSGAELAQNGERQAKRLGAELITGETVEIGFDGSFTVKTAETEYSSKAVLIATGAQRKKPKIDGLETFEGAGVSYCAVCDGFFYRNKNVAVLGSGKYALSEADKLKTYTQNITLLTNGEPLTEILPDGLAVDYKKVVSLRGSDRLEAAVFADGSELSIDGLFIAVGVAGAADFAKKLGVETEGSRIVTDENRKTNLPGLFAAGDCTGGILQVSAAVGEGAAAGLEIIKFLKSSK